MTAKQYLMQIKKIDGLIESKTNEVRSLYDLATKTTSTLREDKTSGGAVIGDRMAECAVKIADLQDELKREVERLVDLKKEIMQKLDLLDVHYSRLLYKRYFEFKTWEQIAVEMNYSYRQVIRIHGKALQKMNDVIECHIEKVLQLQ